MVKVEIVSAKKTVKFQDITYMSYFMYNEKYYMRAAGVGGYAWNLQEKKWEYDFWNKDVVWLKLEEIKFSIA